MRRSLSRYGGFTLIEIMVSLAIFSIMMGAFYEEFSGTTKNVNDLASRQELMQRGQRTLDFIGEELRLAGVFIGSTPNMSFCTNINATPVNSLMSIATPTTYGQVSYLHSERVTTTTFGSPYLATSVNAVQGASMLQVNASGASVSCLTTNAGTGTTQNAAAFITLDTLQPNLGVLVYQVTSFAGNSIAITPSLNQNVNQFANIYQVIMKTILVDANRNLMLTRWDNNSPSYGLCQPYAVPLVASQGPTSGGGVDGFAVEYTLAGGVTKATIASTDIANVKDITIWLLLRSDFPALNGYVNTETYSFGQAFPITVGPFNDGYRRLLVSKSVEIINVGY